VPIPTWVVASISPALVNKENVMSKITDSTYVGNYSSPEYVLELVEQTRSKYPVAVDDYDSTTIHLYFLRNKTSQEIKADEERAKSWEEHRRQQYEQLKKEFGE
jgi:hypothetical protein